ncbi:MAG: AI-2E family transporter [Defluviitaleaceae bacterium]|nr:AI-2E family transporter [Defluviitaleaceae bacterium]
MDHDKKPYRRVAMYAFMVVAAGTIFIFIAASARNFLVTRQYINILNVINPFMYGFILAYLLNPMMSFYERKAFKKMKRKPKRAVSMLCTFTTMIVIIFLIAQMVIPQIGSSMEQLVGRMTDLFTVVETETDISDETDEDFVLITESAIFGGAAEKPAVYQSVYLENYENDQMDFLDFDRLMSTRLGVSVAEATAGLQESIDKMGLNINIEQSTRELLISSIASITVFFREYSASILSATTSFLLTTARQIINFLIGIIIALYLLMDKERLMGQVKKLMFAFLPTFLAIKIVDVTRKTHHIVGGFVSGKMFESVIIFFITLIFMNVVGFEYPMLISTIIGITNVIPFFGPFIGAIPSIFFLMINDVGQGLWFAVFILVLQQVDGNFIGPKILGQYVGLSSFWVIFAILIMNGFFGLFGMFLGVPVFAVVYSLVKDYAYACLRNKGLPVQAEDLYVPAYNAGVPQSGAPAKHNRSIIEQTIDGAKFAWHKLDGFIKKIKKKD